MAHTQTYPYLPRVTMIWGKGAMNTVKTVPARSGFLPRRQFLAGLASLSGKICGLDRSSGPAVIRNE